MQTSVKILSLIFFFFVSTINSNTIIVDINGSGQYTSIQPAFNSASVGDTVKILPGIYDAALSLTKDIVVIGSGYENTKITSNNNPTLTMTSGKIMWVSISSVNGIGIYLNGGSVKNVVIQGCGGSGVYSDDGSPSIVNCAIINNAQYGVWRDEDYPYNGQTNVTNTICFNNGNYDFREVGGTLSVSYSNGELSGINNPGPGNINQDPKFISATDLHLQGISPCWDTGNTSMTDPDGTRSDMGYFGGTDCPIYPVVTQIKIIPQDNGEIQIQAVGLSNY